MLIINLQTNVQNSEIIIYYINLLAYINFIEISP